jgi:hypothetical protein
MFWRPTPDKARVETEGQKTTIEKNWMAEMMSAVLTRTLLAIALTASFSGGTFAQESFNPSAAKQGAAKDFPKAKLGRKRVPAAASATRLDDRPPRTGRVGPDFPDGPIDPDNSGGPQYRR